MQLTPQHPFAPIASAVAFLRLQHECFGLFPLPIHPHTPAETCPAITKIKSNATRRLAITQLEYVSNQCRMSTDINRRGGTLYSNSMPRARPAETSGCPILLSVFGINVKRKRVFLHDQCGEVRGADLRNRVKPEEATGG